MRLPIRSAPGVLAIVVLVGVNSSSAQTSATSQTAVRSANDIAVVRTSAPIFVVPDASREPLRMAKEGSALRLLEQEGGWCKVEFEDPQYGRRIGYVEARFVRVTVGRSEPVDVSIAESKAATPTDLRGLMRLKSA